MTTPTFRAPSAPEEPAVGRADIIQVDTALQSMRDSGFDLTAAAGEPIDNSIEAGASLIRVLTRYGSNKASINEIAFADNGTGIDPGIVAHVLSMGYSTRYGQRGSLGRFGVAISTPSRSAARPSGTRTSTSPRSPARSRATSSPSKPPTGRPSTKTP